MQELTRGPRAGRRRRAAVRLAGLERQPEQLRGAADDVSSSATCSCSSIRAGREAWISACWARSRRSRASARLRPVLEGAGQRRRAVWTARRRADRHRPAPRAEGQPSCSSALHYAQIARLWALAIPSPLAEATGVQPLEGIELQLAGRNVTALVGTELSARGDRSARRQPGRWSPRWPMPSISPGCPAASRASSSRSPRVANAGAPRFAAARGQHAQRRAGEL